MFISMHSILGWTSFCMNCCINAAWHEGNQLVALLRCNGSPGCFDSGFQVIWIVQIITDCGNFTLDFKQHGFCTSPLFLQTLGPWFPNEMQNFLSSEKRTLDHWVTVQLFFSLAQVRCFWRCLCFRSGLVALFLKMSERGDSWCTDSSFSSLLVKLSQVFESALLDSILKLTVISLVACAYFTTQFPSSQLCI